MQVAEVDEGHRLLIASLETNHLRRLFLAAADVDDAGFNTMTVTADTKLDSVTFLL